MNVTIRSFGSAALAAALLLALTGCVTHVERPVTRTVYVPAPPPPVVTPAPAPVTASAVIVIQSENDFYQPLSPYGEWVVVGTYGRVWRPAHVEVGWRPYANGYWRRTDAGWYWASDEPWGWATYHYGRWDWSVQFGWFWVPQTQWAPAWVSWRQGAGYVGWAPLPPAARIAVSGSVVVGESVIAPRFVFVEERRFLEPVRPATVIVHNTTIVNKTVNITKIKVVNKTVVNEGPRVDVVERTSGRRIETVPAHDLRKHEETEVAARRHNGPATADHNDVRPPTRSEREPAKAVLPRDAHVSARPDDTVKERQPAVTDARTRGLEERNAVARPDSQPGAREMERNERKPEPNRANTDREPRRVEAPKNTRPSLPTVAATESRPAPTVLPRTEHPVEKPVRPENARAAAAREHPAQPAGKPAEARMTSPKAAEASAGKNNAMRKNDQKKKGDEEEKKAEARPHR